MERRASLVERDQRRIWHPASHFADHEAFPPLPVHAARGCWLELEDGRTILDAISSWWTCLHGHGHPTIVTAIRDQVERIDHVMFAGFTHAAAVDLADALVDAAPSGFGRVFFADCGSAAIEVALKMSFQARLQAGSERRKRFAALTHGYHGETLGALSVSGMEAFRTTFAPLLPEVVWLPSPAFPNHRHADLSTSLGWESDATELAISMLAAHANELTALVLEPSVQCAGKMRMVGSGFIRRIVEAAQRLGIHVIADEIAVAFGRTGRMFASDWSAVVPDFLCLSKGLSGGILPLSCVLIREGFETNFAGSPARSFLHSHTFTGNPIACAAGLASLELLRARLPSLPEVIEDLRVASMRVTEHPRVLATRQAGTIVAFDVDTSGLPHGHRTSLALRQAAIKRNVLLRPLHDTVYWMPPLSITRDEIDHLATTTLEVIHEVCT